MNIKRIVGQRLSGTRTWGIAVLAGFGLLVAAIPVRAWDLNVYVTPGAGAGAVNGVTPTFTRVGMATNILVTLNATTTNTDYKFSDWASFDDFQFTHGSFTTNVIQIKSTNNTDVALYADFLSIAPVYTLVVNKGPGGFFVSPAGTNGPYARGASQSLSAMASNALPNFYVFDQWTGDNADVANTSTNRTSITFQGVVTNPVITATFKQQFAYTGIDPRGPGTGLAVTSLVSGASLTAMPQAPFVPGIDADHRYACIGWTDGVGNGIPVSSNSTSWATILNDNFTNRWVWTNMFALNVNGQAGVGTITITPPNGYGNVLPATVFVPTGQVVKLTATGLAGYQFLGWQVNSTSSVAAGVLTITNNGPNTVLAQFALIGSDSDGDGLPDWWEKKYGLDPNIATGMDGGDGDPDHDGLSNLEEFQIQYTNKNWYANPMSADTDKDGMDDYYERYSVDPTNSPNQGQQGQTVSAVLDTVGDNGPQGNRDLDYHWSTNSGYQLTSVPLVNSEEWTGPDGRAPVLFTNVTFGMTTVFGVTTNLYPFSNDRGPVYMMIPNRPPFNTVNPDTFDQSRGNTAFSDSDKFDDGYEYSWDLWQQNNGGYKEIFLAGVTNAIPVYITNTVPVWDGETNSTRLFNPGTAFIKSDAEPDGDVLYDYKSGKVSDSYYSTLMEYNAWKANAFTPTVAGAPHSIRMDTPPSADNPPRSSHPFLMDVDKDGLPDGYEVIFGYDPWAKQTPGVVGKDGDDNPDGDWMAKNGTNMFVLRNHEVYTANRFDPRVAVDQTYPVAKNMPGPGTDRSPTTEKYSNIEEMWGPDGIMVTTPTPITDDATHPLKVDSDGDGIWDGWENYVGLNPNDPNDGGTDTDGDKLSNLGEFQSFYTSSTNRTALTPLADWMNKIFPTDPNAKDTDGDGLGDNSEKTPFNGASATVTNAVLDTDGNIVTQVFAAATWNGQCYTGGGLNPTTCDTDGDTMPDPYEASYPTALNGTLGDAFLDPDNDGLPNYLEYYSASIWHWQYDTWTTGAASYNSSYFFQGTPKAWEWHTKAGTLPFKYIPFFGPTDKPNIFAYAGCNPGLVDTDDDGMDDYYECYHGLNPIYGRIDILASRATPAETESYPYVADPRTSPWVNGSPMMDSDGDGLPNSTEAPNLSVTSQVSPGYHTDPTPIWMTDVGYARSWVNLYYTPAASVWYWSGKLPPPTYAFDFEMNEGFDTDNDGYSDKEELNTTQTDPLSPEHPIKRRALKFDGVNSLARTIPSDVPSLLVSSRGKAKATQTEDTLRSFTVEAWVRPIAPASGHDQVVMERPVMVDIGNPMLISPGLRLNFRLALDGTGVPYVTYTGEGREIIFRDAKASSATVLPTNTWTHLCGTYQVASSTNLGVLTLYVNGRQAAQTNPSELPAIGHFGTGSIIWFYNAPIVVGASDLSPASFLSGTPANYFKGWIDEIRIWDGARSGSEVAAGMRVRMKQADVLANSTNSTIAKLLCLYDCDNLPDPDHSPTAPAGLGFDVTGTAIYPTDWLYVGFWGAEANHSFIYSDYRYLPWIENAAAHTPVAPAYDVGDPKGMTSVTNVANGVTNVVQTVMYPNTWDPYGLKYYTAPDGLDDHFIEVSDMLPLGWTEADEDVPMWDNGTVPATTPYDSDGDGLPDDWEEAHGLNPLDATGVNGASGDLDGDGLSNLAEFRAGTDPTKFDTDGDGVGDYDSRQGPGYRTYGEIYDDGDGIPDLWEEQYKDRCLTTGKRGLDPAYYDANLDPDEDGWDNYSEYLARTDPLDHHSFPMPQIKMTLRYAGKLGATLEEAEAINGPNALVRLSFYHTASMDGFPDAELNTSVPEFYTNIVGTAANDWQHIWQGNNYIFGYFDANGNGTWEPDTEPAGIAQFQPIDIGWGTVNYIEVSLTDSMPGYPRFTWAALPGAKEYQVRSSSPAYLLTLRAPTTFFHEGHWLATGNYGMGASDSLTYNIYADGNPYLDIDQSAFPRVSALATPAIATPHDSVFKYAWNEIEFMADKNATSYTLQIAPSSNGAAGDIAVSSTGILPYQDINGKCKVALPFYAGDKYVPAGGAYASSTWTNDRYWVRIQSSTPSISTLSSWSAINLNVTPTNWSTTIGGDVYYYGKVNHGYGTGPTTNRLTIIVQAFESLGFSGVPDGQCQVEYVCYTNAPSDHKGSFALMGLHNKVYYLRAFIDVNGNRKLDSWEPVGFAAIMSPDKNGYTPKAIDLSGGNPVDVENTQITIRDRDTDGDGLPDGWEWMYFGTLDKGAHDKSTANWSTYSWTNGLPWTTTNSSTTIDLIDCYRIDPLDLNPTAVNGDTDGDGVCDFDEVCYSDRIAGTPPNINDYNPYDPITNPKGTDLNPMKWDTDGDGLSDGYELAHGLDPLNPHDGAAELARARAAGITIPGVPNVSQIAVVGPGTGQFSLKWQGQRGMTYEVQSSDDLKAWKTVPNGPYRYGAALHNYVDQSPNVTTRFYRVLVK